MHGGTQFVGEARGFEESHRVALLSEEDCCTQTADACSADCDVEGSLGGIVVSVDAIDAIDTVRGGPVCKVHSYGTRYTGRKEDNQAVPRTENLEVEKD